MTIRKFLFLNYNNSSKQLSLNDCFAGNIDRLVDACPNIEELHVSFGNFCWDETGMAETRDFFSTIRFEKLKWLTVGRLCLRDGSRFPLVRK